MLLRRILDICLSSFGLAISAPVLLPLLYLIWRQDRNSPFYCARRVGLDGREFTMVKLRSMVAAADSSGVDSTSVNDRRITPVGHFVRRFKLDELPQLWNVLKGDMTLVGPRPNVKRETDLYTEVERGLLSVKPGITDLSSIVFADEGEILKDSKDPDLDYNQLIRPWKSRLGLFYAAHRSALLDLQLIALTVRALVCREAALAGIQGILRKLGAEQELVAVAGRKERLLPHPPPGAAGVVRSR